MGRKYLVTRSIPFGGTKPINESLAELSTMLTQLNKGIDILNKTMSEGIQQSKDASILAEKLIVKLGEKDESSGP